MPIYDYLCAACGPFEARRPMSESAAHSPCMRCQSPAPRTVSAPRLNLMSSMNRYAETRNEKSAHEPDVVHTLAPHGHGHGHAHAPPTNRHRNKHAAHGPARPWMVGH